MIRINFVVTIEFILQMLPNFQVTKTLHLFLASGVDTYYGLAQKNSSMGEEAALGGERPGTKCQWVRVEWEEFGNLGEGMRNLSYKSSFSVLEGLFVADLKFLLCKFAFSFCP